MTAKELKSAVDELGALDAAIAGLEDKKKRADELRGKVRLFFALKDSSKGFSADGSKYSATIGPMGNERRITSMPKVFELVGQEAFLADCSYTLKALEKRVLPSDMAQLVTSERTGTRPVKTFEKTK